jgi:[acyl-carrier-protein] S-malonyltransferase
MERPSVRNVRFMFMICGGLGAGAHKSDLRVSAVAGLSLGELTAQAMRGSTILPPGLRIVAERARLMGECAKQAPGTMAAVVGATEAQLEGLIAACNIEIANRNCPGRWLSPGTEAGIEMRRDCVGARAVWGTSVAC